jgi:hypothetical protein
MQNDFDIIDGKLNNYRGKEKIVVIPEGVTVIGKSAFAFCKTMGGVEFPESLTVIEDCAFTCCRLHEITLPDNLTYIGKEIFRYCPLEELTVFGEVFDLNDVSTEYDDEMIAINNGLNPDEISGIMEIAQFTAASEIPILLFNGEYDDLDMPENLRCDIISRVLKNKPKHRNFLNMVKNHIVDLFGHILRDSDVIMFLIENGVITSENIDECIRIANENNANGINDILTEYKASIH